MNSSAGRLPLTCTLTPAGDPVRLSAGNLSLIQYPAHPLLSSLAGVYASIGGSAPERLTGPETGRPGRDGVNSNGCVFASLHDFSTVSGLSIDDDSRTWSWGYALTNRSERAATVQLTCVLDVALASIDDVQRNEQYVAQYLDLTPVVVGSSTALAVRQNMPGETNPWAVVASTLPVAHWGTDALQLEDEERGYGLDMERELGTSRLQHEHTAAILRTREVLVEPGETLTGDFWGFVLEDHSLATSDADAATIAAISAGRVHQALPSVPSGEVKEIQRSAIAEARLIDGDDLSLSTAAEFFGIDERIIPEGEEWAKAGQSSVTHWVLGAKEREVLRPHGQILHCAPSARPENKGTASTVWMNGVFASQLTHGHACDDPVLSIRRGYLGTARLGGVQAYVKIASGLARLGIPTLFSIQEGEATWFYKLAGEQVRLVSRVDAGGHAMLTLDATGSSAQILFVIEGTENPLELSLAVQSGSAQEVAPERELGSGAAGQRLRVISVDPFSAVSLKFGAHARGAEYSDSSVEAHAWRLPSLISEHDGAEIINDTLRDLFHDARIHYQAPRGLEQYIGGAWGTRDVAQGPMGLLLATNENAAMRDVVAKIFAGQQDDGSWPQWFHYLEEHAEPGFRDGHGDVVYWPLLALAEYLEATADATILAEPARFVGREAYSAPVPIVDHIVAALDYIEAHRTADPRLPAYGHGDWNDSLQPASPELARTMCSTWTTQLEMMSLDALALQLREHGASYLADRAHGIAERTREAWAELLEADGELAGYAVITGAGDKPQLIVHPRDERTGLKHGSLQIVHAIIDEALTPEQAENHVKILREHLVGPFGLYLFDTPVRYHGGELTLFKRAEAASFWGREIGLMYTHLHIRYVEALLRLGYGEEAWKQLLQIMPRGLDKRVPGTKPRQSNVYYSSHDLAFRDRYDANQNNDLLWDKTAPNEGGWRIYSSGPGLILRMITQHIVGVRAIAAGVEFDPVLPSNCEPVAARIPFDGDYLDVEVKAGVKGHGVARVVLDGVDITQRGTKVARRYREGGILIPAGLVQAGSKVEVITN